MKFRVESHLPDTHAQAPAIEVDEDELFDVIDDELYNDAGKVMGVGFKMTIERVA